MSPLRHSTGRSRQNHLVQGHTYQDHG
jgi:hypothetical protein